MIIELATTSTPRRRFGSAVILEFTPPTADEPNLLFFNPFFWWRLSLNFWEV
jgi:hypothetical protein